jgi:uncharacterized protein YwgA
VDESINLIFLDTSSGNILGFLNENKELFGAVRIQKLVFLLWKEFQVPFKYCFDKLKMGPHSWELKADLDYLKDVGCIQIEEKSTDDEHDLRIYKITKKGEKLLEEKHYRDLYNAYIDRFRLLLQSYRSVKGEELLNYVHSKYTDDLYGPDLMERFKIMNKDAKLAEIFWENLAKEYEVTPFWYLSVFLRDIKEVPQDIKVRELIFELYDLLMKYSKDASRYLIAQQGIGIGGRNDIQNLIYDKCYVILKTIGLEMVTV